MYNPLDWNRYAYVRWNPINFNDPDGYRACEDSQANGCGNNHYATAYEQLSDEKRQDYLFSLMFLGSRKNNSWTVDDWKYYYGHKDELWNDPSSWVNPDNKTGWDLFALHVDRLSSHYSSSEKGQFTEDFALAFGGIPRSAPWPQAAFGVKNGPKTLNFLHEGNDGLDSHYTDTLSPNDNQSHHYAGIFFLSYHVGSESAIAINYFRDTDNPGDINLGRQAALDAYVFRNIYNDPRRLSEAILRLKSYQVVKGY
ncbi:MAG TPA: hypothetical protein VMT46_05450 [Anaerolineaceae bacterium]|nr:hypothetical protein [Anaerolineaceae bacterium]